MILPIEAWKEIFNKFWGKDSNGPTKPMIVIDSISYKDPDETIIDPLVTICARR